MGLFEVPRMRHYRTLAAGKVAAELGPDQVASIRIDGKKVGDPKAAHQAFLDNLHDDPGKVSQWIDAKAEQLSARANEYVQKFAADPHFEKSIERLNNRRSAQAFMDLMELDCNVHFAATAEVTLKDGTTRTMSVDVVDVEASLDVLRMMLLGTLPGLIPLVPFVGNIGGALSTAGAATSALFASMAGDKPKAKALWNATKRQAGTAGASSVMGVGTFACVAAVLASMRDIEELRAKTPTVSDIVKLGQ